MCFGENTLSTSAQTCLLSLKKVAKPLLENMCKRATKAGVSRAARAAKTSYTKLTSLYSDVFCQSKTRDFRLKSSRGDTFI